jgi:hypothetical protein
LPASVTTALRSSAQSAAAGLELAEAAATGEPEEIALALPALAEDRFESTSADDPQAATTSIKLHVPKRLAFIRRW